ncbi:SDR family NAD(P)-dependent oxidoreductase [soil metagenome]
MSSLDGRIALITGASFGIGEATARRLVREGARVICAARSEARLQELCEELNTAAQRNAARPLVLDVADPISISKALASLPPDWAEIDILVNNAGLAKGLGPVHENTVDQIDATVDVNVKGVLYMIREVVPGMLERGRGHVVNLGSIAGHAVYAGGTVYCATKFALRAITDGLKIDLHGTPVRVSAVSPGLVETDFSRVRFDGDEERARKVYADTNPLTAEDVADAIAYAVCAPEHVNIREIVMTPRVQSSVTHLVRGEAAQDL